MPKACSFSSNFEFSSFRSSCCLIVAHNQSSLHPQVSVRVTIKMAVASRSTKGNNPIPSTSMPASSDSDSDSESGSSSSSSEPESDEEITQDYLETLLEKARQNIANAAASKSQAPTSLTRHGEEEIIRLGDEDPEQYAIFLMYMYLSLDAQRMCLFVCPRKLPALDPGVLLDPYITPGATRRDAPARVRDLDAERAESSSSALNSLPAPPVRPPSPSSRLTKKQQKAVRRHIYCLTRAVTIFIVGCAL